MQGIFISYRRQDSQSAAGRLADHLKEHLSEVPLFRDVETIEPGVDFTDTIHRALQSCGVLLAVIGPHWLAATDAAGRRRLENPNDYMRLEIATALARPGVRVIPVLVEGAQIPDADALPEDLQALCRRHAIELSDKRWNFDVSQLIDALRRALGIKPPAPEPAPPPGPIAWYRRLNKKQWGGIAAVVVALGVIDRIMSESADPEPLPLPLPVYPYVPPVPAAPVTSAPNLSGEWQDAYGGRYRLIWHSGQNPPYRFEGLNANGQRGVGWIANNTLMLDYTFNNIRYAAELQISADGNALNGRYGNVSTRESGPVALQRVR